MCAVIVEPFPPPAAGAGARSGSVLPFGRRGGRCRRRRRDLVDRQRREYLSPGRRSCRSGPARPLAPARRGRRSLLLPHRDFQSLERDRRRRGSLAHRRHRHRRRSDRSIQVKHTRLERPGRDLPILELRGRHRELVDRDCHRRGLRHRDRARRGRLALRPGVGGKTILFKNAGSGRHVIVEGFVIAIRSALIVRSIFASDTFGAVIVAEIAVPLPLGCTRRSASALSPSPPVSSPGCPIRFSTTAQSIDAIFTVASGLAPCIVAVALPEMSAIIAPPGAAPPPAPPWPRTSRSAACSRPACSPAPRAAPSHRTQATAPARSSSVAPRSHPRPWARC